MGWETVDRRPESEDRRQESGDRSWKTEERGKNHGGMEDTEFARRNIE
jgi:hypothetical protein